jgi:hypothetical protein
MSPVKTLSKRHLNQPNNKPWVSPIRFTADASDRVRREFNGRAELPLCREWRRSSTILPTNPLTAIAIRHDRDEPIIRHRVPMLFIGTGGFLPRVNPTSATEGGEGLGQLILLGI